VVMEGDHGFLPGGAGTGGSGFARAEVVIRRQTPAIRPR
jgi:hypothetical protein